MLFTLFVWLARSIIPGRSLSQILLLKFQVATAVGPIVVCTTHPLQCQSLCITQLVCCRQELMHHIYFVKSPWDLTLHVALSSSHKMLPIQTRTQGKICQLQGLWILFPTDFPANGKVI